MRRFFVLTRLLTNIIVIYDTPFMDSPYSQKGFTAGIERSSAWLTNLLQPNPGCSSPLNIIVHMAGGTSIYFWGTRIHNR